MKKVKGRDEENLKHPKNDILILQYANTALGNRLDHQKRLISQLKLNESSYRAICECYEFFFTSYFAGWKNFLVKLERLNLLVKRQDSNERQTSKFKQLFESMGEMVQVVNKLKECMEKATKDAILPPQVNTVNSQNNAINQNANTNNSNAVNKQRAQTNAAALSDLQKITKTRVESFLKNFENIYTEVAIDCATYGQRMNDAVKSLAQNNDANETMRRLYRENSQLQTKIKEQENYLSKSIPLADTEKDFIVNYFGNQNRQYEELLQKFNEEREMTENLSLRIRQKMDYCVNSITTKVGQDPNQILAKLLQNSNTINTVGGKENHTNTQQNHQPQQIQNSMEIEEQQNAVNINNNQQNENKIPQNEEKEGFECICGGYQASYFCQKYDETLKMLLETQQKLIATQTIISNTPSSTILSSTMQQASILPTNLLNINTASINGVQANQTEKPASQNTPLQEQQSSQSQNNQSLTLQPQASMNIEGQTNNENNKNSSSNLENVPSLNGNNSIAPVPSLKKAESQQILQQPLLLTQTSTHPGEEICDGKFRLPIAEKLIILQKQNEQLISEKTELEKYIRDMEIEQKNMEDKFFRSGAYQSLAVQTEELLKCTLQLKNQLKESKQQISDIEKLRFREMQEIILKFKEEKETLMRQVQEAREGVYRTQLGEIMRDNLSQHFDYKKYTQPLHDQLEKTSESLSIEREHRQNLEQQKIQLNEQITQLQKTINDLQSKLSEKEQYLLYLESKVGTTGESYVEDKVFKYAKHKETLKFLEKLVTDLQSTGQTNSELVKNFKELVAYIKQREEKLNLAESKIKQAETEKKKLQQNQDQIWKEYDSLDKSFNQLKARCDQYNQELKLSQEREQELECKNLEIQMQFSKEKQSYTIMIAAEQQKKDTTKSIIEAYEEQNRIILQQNTNLTALVEENVQHKNQIQQILEETNIQLLDTQQKLDLITKKYNDTYELYNELIGKHERTQAKLQDAYEVLENNESKNTSAEVASLKEKLQNMRLLLQCSCGENLKDTILQKCLHPFCRQCIDKQIRLRQRTCPKCRTAFGQNDIKTLYLNH